MPYHHSLSSRQDLEDSIGVITDDEEDEKGATRSTAFITQCKSRPELNGRYLRSEDISAYGRPVYEKTVERKINRGFDPKGKGKGKPDLKKLLMPGMMGDGAEEEDVRQETLVIHYRRENTGARNGWWISRDTCGGEGLAWNARETKGPPAGGWFAIRLAGTSEHSGSPPTAPSGTTFSACSRFLFVVFHTFWNVAGERPGSLLAPLR